MMRSVNDRQTKVRNIYTDQGVPQTDWSSHVTHWSGYTRQSRTEITRPRQVQHAQGTNWCWELVKSNNTIYYDEMRKKINQRRQDYYRETGSNLECFLGLDLGFPLRLLPLNWSPYLKKEFASQRNKKINKQKQR
jgi:hypothetical protein